MDKEETKKQLKKLIIFAKNNNLGIFNELQDLNKNIVALTKALTGEETVKVLVNQENETEKEILDTLKVIKDKEQPSFPEIPELDTTQLETLITNLTTVIESRQKEDTLIEIEIV